MKQTKVEIPRKFYPSPNRIGSSKNGTSCIQFSMNTSFRYRHSSLFHDFMDCCTINITHLYKTKKFFISSITYLHFKSKFEERTLSNSSMQTIPRSARTIAPASNLLSPVSGSVVTAAVRPTPEDPRPVVGIALGAECNT